MPDYKGIDAEKLVFKKNYAEAPNIDVRVKSTGKMYTLTRETLIISIKHGNNHHLIQSLFTQDSIKKAMAAPSNKTKSSKNENQA